METNSDTENTKKFICENCTFKCSKKSYWERHIITAKHIKLTKINTQVPPTENDLHKCKNCHKIYKSRVGLWKHQKKCEAPAKKHKLYEKEDIVDVLLKENQDFKNIILELVKNNGDLQKQMLEVCKTGRGGNYKSNNNNKTFNLQVFLNEQCKDAMNLMDFVNSMTLELSDLEDVGTLGYVEGISNIIIRKLNELDIYKRPIHCSDGKREIMYVKDDNIWKKENDTNDKLRLAIKHVTYKNSSLLVPWSQKHPNCMNIQHHLNDVYVKMIGQAMGGKEEFVDSENKIMKKIAKAVLIEKQ